MYVDCVFRARQTATNMRITNKLAVKEKCYSWRNCVPETFLNLLEHTQNILLNRVMHGRDMTYEYIIQNIILICLFVIIHNHRRI